MNEARVQVREFAVQMLVTPATLNRLTDEQRTKTVQRAVTHSLIDFMVVNGVKSLTSDIDVDDSDASMRGAMEVNATVEGIPELTLLALTAKQAQRQEALVTIVMAVNDVPWWKFLWLKLRGRRLVEVV